MAPMSTASDIAPPKIPYGRADFRGIRLDGSLYVDKTRFVRQLEDHTTYFFHPASAVRQDLLAIDAGVLLRPQQAG